MLQVRAVTILTASVKFRQPVISCIT
jgi:hypothetical protein